MKLFTQKSSEKKTCFIITMAVVSMLLQGLFAKDASCRQLQPAEERVRPFTTPPKSWTIEADLTTALGQKDGAFRIEAVDNAIFLKVPYVPVSKRIMIHLLTPGLRILTIGDFTATDSTLALSGRELGIYLGIRNVTLPIKSRFNLHYGASFDYKSLLWERSWLFADGGGTLDIDRYWNTWLEFGLGRQLPKNMSICASVLPSVFEYDHFEDSFIGKDIAYSVMVPLDFKIASSRHYRSLLRTGFALIKKRRENDPFIGALAGFQFSWHW
jgi:hypothetical protein